MFNLIKKLITKEELFEASQLYEHKFDKNKLFRLIEEIGEATYKYLLVNEYGIIKSKQLEGSIEHLFNEYNLLKPKYINFKIVDTKSYKQRNSKNMLLSTY